MALSKLPQKRSDGVEYIDTRGSLYFNKHRYRARVIGVGMNILWFAKSTDDIKKKIDSQHRRFKGANVPVLSNVFEFIQKYPKKKHNYALRIEHDTAAFFSNDLNFLKTLESTGAFVDYTEVDSTVPEGVKYFVNEPTHKYRIYLRSKHVQTDFAPKLKNFFERYKDTDTKLRPSPALTRWLTPESHSRLLQWPNWRQRFCSSTYFFDYNDESMITLFTLMFDGMISKRYKLEKRP